MIGKICGRYLSRPNAKCFSSQKERLVRFGSDRQTGLNPGCFENKLIELKIHITIWHYHNF